MTGLPWAVRDVDFAFLCDAAAGTTGGKLQASGIGVDTFDASVLPAVLPLLFVGRISGLDPASECSIRVIGADGLPVFEEVIDGCPVQARAGRPWKLPVLRELLVPAAAAGDYRLDLVVDGALLHSIAYWVEWAPRRRG